MSDNGLTIFCKQNLLDVYKGDPLYFCIRCAFGKQTRITFSKEMTLKTRDKLNCIHLDLWSSKKLPSKSGGQYYMTLIDDYFRMVTGVHIEI